MKKTLFGLSAMLMLSSSVYAVAEYNHIEFTDNLRECNVYASADYSGKKIIRGWRAGKCIYNEKNNNGEMYVCTFTAEQIKELADTIRIYGYSNQKLTIQYTNGEKDSFYSGYASIIDWTNFVNMPGVCYKN